MCDARYPGTREGLILVVTVPPSPTLTDPAPAAGAPGDLVAQRRRELADFLTTCRARLQPEDVGLPRGTRRRTPGLRREEVAALAGVGATWYTWLEQGRDVRASVEVLEAIAGALELTGIERSHLLALGRGDQLPAQESVAETASPTVVRLLGSLAPHPAFVIGRRWDYLAWTSGAAALFGDLTQRPREERNLIWLMFMDPVMRTRWPDWQTTANLFVAKFRASHARSLGDPAFEALITTLKRESPEFAAAWRRHEVATSRGGQVTIEHATAGLLTFTSSVFTLQEEDEQRLLLYTPAADSCTPDQLAELTAGFSAAVRSE